MQNLQKKTANLTVGRTINALQASQRPLHRATRAIQCCRRRSPMRALKSPAREKGAHNVRLRARSLKSRDADGPLKSSAMAADPWERFVPRDLLFSSISSLEDVVVCWPAWIFFGRCPCARVGDPWRGASGYLNSLAATRLFSLANYAGWCSRGRLLGPLSNSILFVVRSPSRWIIGYYMEDREERVGFPGLVSEWAFRERTCGLVA